MAGLTLETIPESNRHYYIVAFHGWYLNELFPWLTDDTRHEVAGQESNKVGQQPGGGERNEAGKWAAAPLEAADVNHLTEWAAPNCKEIMEAEL